MSRCHFKLANLSMVQATTVERFLFLIIAGERFMTIKLNAALLGPTGVETSVAPFVSQAEKGAVGDRCRLLQHGESMGDIHTLAEWLMLSAAFSLRFEISHHTIPVAAFST
jgi:hypothetical protein